MAEFIGSWSKDPSTKIGCVIIEPKERQIISLGYNGFPSDIEDCEKRLNEREIKYTYMIHAEMNAILNAAKQGKSVKDCYMYISGLQPCSDCAKSIIQTGIKKIYYRVSNPNIKWDLQWEKSKNMFDEAKIKYKILK